MIRSKTSDLVLEESRDGSVFGYYLQGIFCNLSNPKIVIFYLAFLPQFLPVGAANPMLQLFVLGMINSLLAFMIKAPIGLGAGSLASWIKTHPSVQTWINRTSGGILIGLGIRLAMEKKV